MHIFKKLQVKKSKLLYSICSKADFKTNQMSNQILGFWIYKNQIPNQLVCLKYQSNQILCYLRDDFSNQMDDQIVSLKWNNWYSNIEFQSFERAYCWVAVMCQLPSHQRCQSQSLSHLVVPIQKQLMRVDLLKMEKMFFPTIPVHQCYSTKLGCMVCFNSQDMKTNF